jgi:hypothetical protein
MQEGFCVRRKVTHALRALGGPVASVRHGQGGVHGEARAVPARRIGHRGRHGAGGEVTVQGWSVALCPRSGVLGGHGDVLGGVGWLGQVSARWGQARGQQDGVHPLGVGGGIGRGSRRERGRGSGRVWPQAPLLPFDPTRYDKVDLWQDFLAGLCKDFLVKPLWSV